MPVFFADDALVVEHGEPDAPLSLSLRGVQDADGSLWLRGKGVSGLQAGARIYPAGFFAKPVGDRYEGRGRLGRRECAVIVITSYSIHYTKLYEAAPLGEWFLSARRRRRHHLGA